MQEPMTFLTALKLKIRGLLPEVVLNNSNIFIVEIYFEVRCPHVTSSATPSKLRKRTRRGNLGEREESGKAAKTPTGWPLRWLASPRFRTFEFSPRVSPRNFFVTIS